MIANFKEIVQEFTDNSILSPAHGRVGARATFLSFYISSPPPSEKITESFQQAGKKRSEAASRTELALVREKGKFREGPEGKPSASYGVKIFVRLLTAPKARQGWEAALLCVSRETKLKSKGRLKLKS